jgi:hypothetical protein
VSDEERMARVEELLSLAKGAHVFDGGEVTSIRSQLGKLPDADLTGQVAEERLRREIAARQTGSGAPSVAGMFRIGSAIPEGNSGGEGVDHEPTQDRRGTEGRRG